MPAKIAVKIKNLWTLPYESRWTLYKFWHEGYIREKNDRIKQLHQMIREKYVEIQENRTIEDINVCRQALVVGMTTTGAAKFRKIVQQLNPRIVVVEEAAQILESHIVTSLASDTQHLILIGDHQQLRPSPTVYMLATKYGMNISLFERMIENGLECFRLETQHRMRPEIASLITPHIYAKLYNHESVKTFENIKGVAKNLFFVNHSNFELQENESKSKVNNYEATFILKFCKYLINQGYDPSQITVLTTYSGQLFEFKKSPLKTVLEGVRFTVVDNYQGEENDLILISFVRSNEEGQIGFLKITNRVCVALSRARKGLYCIGNFGLLAEKSNLWKNIIKTLDNNQAIGPSIVLMCQNHPDTSRAVKNHSDFDFVPEGGCTEQCRFRLSCGHQCFLKCHPYDPAHLNIQSPKPCAKHCVEGHARTFKCYEECPPCDVLMPKTIENCGHNIQVSCHLLRKLTPCTESCKKLLPCGHQCFRKCGQSCTQTCLVKVTIKSSICDHELDVECSKSKDLEILMMKCLETCSADLPCGHKCKGTCSSCYQGRLHMICMESCNRKLVCGHTCKSRCYRNCPPCEEICEKYCVHKKCKNKCCEPCEKCMKRCKWSCSHNKCTRLCSEPCDRTLCDKTCPKTLKCEHPCIGVCGERCPKECRICDKEKVEEGCFGRQVKADDMFVCLDDCEHIFEVDGLRQWAINESLSGNIIRLKNCPTCQIVIRKSLHFERNAESFYENLEKIKNAVSGNKYYNNKLNLILRQRVKIYRNSHSMFYSSSPFHAVRSKLKEAVESMKQFDTRELSTMENILSIMELWPSHAKRFCMRPGAFRGYYPSLADKLKDYLNLSEKWVGSYMAKRLYVASEQQLKDLMWEVHRLKLIDKLGELIVKVQVQPDDKVCSLLNQSINTILTYSPFREKQLSTFIFEFQNLSRYAPHCTIDILELQKQPVLHVMSFSEGHWFLCEKGHAYSVVKCGVSTEESKCYECVRNIICKTPLLPNPPLKLMDTAEARNVYKKLNRRRNKQKKQ